MASGAKAADIYVLSTLRCMLFFSLKAGWVLQSMASYTGSQPFSFFFFLKEQIRNIKRKNTVFALQKRFEKNKNVERMRNNNPNPLIFP